MSEIKIDFIEDFGTKYAKRYPLTAAGISECMNNNEDVFSCSIGEYLDRILKGHYSNIKAIRATGIQDKNGKDVFEGDAVKNSAAKFVVVFNKGCFAVKQIGLPDRETYLALRAAKEIEIIGNININPELLK